MKKIARQSMAALDAVFDDFLRTNRFRSAHCNLDDVRAGGAREYAFEHRGSEYLARTTVVAGADRDWVRLELPVAEAYDAPPASTSSVDIVGTLPGVRRALAAVMGDGASAFAQSDPRRHTLEVRASPAADVVGAGLVLAFGPGAPCGSGGGDRAAL